MLQIPKQYKSLKFIKPIKWKDIFDAWKKGEAHQSSWKKHWESRGFSSWDEWRKAYVKPLSSENLQWFLYSIENPIEDLPFFYGTPTCGWIEKAYGGEKTKMLVDLLNLPIIANNDKILSIKKDFSKETILTGISCEDKIVLIEGMHRSCALASWNKKQKLNSQVKIALALWKKEIPKLGGNYKKSKK